MYINVYKDTDLVRGDKYPDPIRDNISHIDTFIYLAKDKKEVEDDEVREDDEVVEDDEVKVMEHETTPHYNLRSSV